MSGFWCCKKNVNDNEPAETEITEINAEEEIKVESKKSYFYIAVDENDNVVLNDSNEPIISFETEEGSAVQWPDYVKNSRIYKNIKCNTSLRVELPDNYKKLNRNDKKQVKKDCKNRLITEIAKDKIEEARSAMSGNISENAEQKVCTSVDEVPEQKAFVPQDRAEEPKVKKAEELAEDIKIEDTNKDVLDPELIEKKLDDLGWAITNGFDDNIATVKKELLPEIRRIIEGQGKINNDIKGKVDGASRSMANEIGRASDSINRQLTKTEKNIIENQESISSKLTAAKTRISDIGDSVETIEGKLGKLDEITELLKNKGLSMSMEIPPVNADEEDIVNLVRYSQKITEQLGYAARELIRKQEAIRSQAESNKNEQKIIAQKIDDEYKRGSDEGKKMIIQNLIDRFEDIDRIKDAEDSYVHMIWSWLTDIGAVISGEGRYEKGKEIVLTSDDIEKMMGTYSQLDGAGKYRVVRTGLSYNNDIISAACFEKITEDNCDEEADQKATSENGNGSTSNVNEEKTSEEE